MTFPKELNIDVTNDCNKACSICPMKDRKKRNLFPIGYMNMEMYMDIVSQMCGGTEKPIINLHMCGEPLLHPHIGDMVNYASLGGCFTHFATNGILLGEKKKEIVDSGLDLLTISVDGNIPSESINEFMNFKGKQNPITQIKYYSDDVLFEGKLPKVDKLIHGQLHEWTDSKKRKNNYPCTKLISGIAITWDGYYSICCVDYKREMAPFNIKTTSIKEAWRLNEVLFRGQEIGWFLSPCKTCNYWEERNDSV